MDAGEGHAWSQMQPGPGQDRHRERKHSESRDQRRGLCYMGVGLRGAEWRDQGVLGKRPNWRQ